MRRKRKEKNIEINWLLKKRLPKRQGSFITNPSILRIKKKAVQIEDL